MKDPLKELSARLVGPLARIAMPTPRRLWTGIGFGALSAACSVGLLAASSYLIAAAALQPPILYLEMVIVGVRAFALGRAFFRYLERIASHDATFRMLGRLRTAVFAAIIPGAPASLSSESAGETVSRFVSDVDDLQDLPLRVWQPLLVSGIVCGASVVGCALVSIPAAGVLLACLVLAGVLGAVVPGRLSASAARGVAPERARQFDETARFIRDIDVLTAFDAVKGEKARILEGDRRLFGHSLRLVWSKGFGSAALTVASGLAVLGSYLVATPSETAGELAGPLLVLVVLAPMSVLEVFEDVATAVTAVRRVKTSAGRLAELVPDPVLATTEAAEAIAKEQKPEIGADRRPAFAGLELRSAGFGWDGHTPVVHGVNLALEPGMRVLVTGESGAGKSTLAWGLVRFLPLLSGAYLINEEPADAHPDAWVRRIVGICEQSPHVFDSSVRANLKLADPDAVDSALEDVLERVALWDALSTREGLDTRVGESGGLLSGGQVQRLALARALLGRFPVIVFDEPTANVDPELGQELMRDVLEIARDAEFRPAVVLMSHERVPASWVDAHVRLGG